MDIKTFFTILGLFFTTVSFGEESKSMQNNSYPALNHSWLYVNHQHQMVEQLLQDSSAKYKKITTANGSHYIDIQNINPRETSMIFKLKKELSSDQSKWEPLIFQRAICFDEAKSALRFSIQLIAKKQNHVIGYDMPFSKKMCVMWGC